jgi:alpha-L-fucosidase
MSSIRAALIFLLLGALPAGAADRYAATTQSLRTHHAPQWYEDAKFGIFIHWGPYSVPAYHEWYVDFISPKANYGFLFGTPPYTAERGELPEELFLEKTRSEAVEYHRKNWGADFPYDGFLPMFRAEKFDPAAWARLFRDAGAQYVVLTAKHGDEFAMWPSKYTHRNAMETGPKRDVAGDLTTAVRAAGMKMGFYHNTTYTFWDARYPGRDWVEYMNNSIKELVDLYHPSVLWGDVLTGPVRDERGRPLPADYWGAKQVLAYYYNHSPEPLEVVANDRWGLDYDGKTLGDFATPERTRMTSIRKDKWETCDSLDPHSWGYNRSLPISEYMTPNQVVDYLADVVSKNGNLLINIGPRADGTIPEVMAACLRRVGEWLRVNGEAIYGSRYWDVPRDGDVRFTRKGNVLYAIALEWPEDPLTLTSLAGKEVLKVEMLGLGEPVKWRQVPEALVIDPPSHRPCRYAYTFRITCKSL